MKKRWKYIGLLIVFLLLTTNHTQAAGFTDIQEGQNFYKEMMYLLDKEVITGYGDGTFRPANKVTRAAAAAMIGRSLDFDGAKKESSFKDVAKDSFASGYIEEAVEKKIIKGYTDGTFRPNEEVTRGQMAIFISRAFQLIETKDVLFFDVSERMAAYPFIGKILSAGITHGYSDWTFRPDQELTRAEFSTFLARALDEKFKVTLPVIKPITIEYKITEEGKIASNYHNGTLLVLKPSQEIHLNKISDGKATVLVDGKVLDFKDEKTLIAVGNGVGSITVVPEINSWESAFTIEVLVGAKEDIGKSVLNQHFLELADSGYLNGCEFSVNHVRSEDLLDYYSTEPDWIGYYEGGFGRSYDGCIYFAADQSGESPIGAITMDGSKITKSPSQIKGVLGRPDSEGYSEMDGSWLMYYRLKNGYELFFSFDSPGSKLNHLLYKDRTLN
jgi:hypothetical protein